MWACIALSFTPLSISVPFDMIDILDHILVFFVTRLDFSKFLSVHCVLGKLITVKQDLKVEHHNI